MSGRTLKVIETRFDGHLFRSRLEARWATFFKALNIEYVYEPEGFDLGDAGWYLPDFWLPAQDSWVEIKGSYPNQADRAKMAAFAHSVEPEVFCFYRSDFQSPYMDRDQPPGREFIGAWLSRMSSATYDEEPHFGFRWSECIICKEDTIVDAGPTAFEGIRRFTSKPGFFGLAGSSHWAAHAVSSHSDRTGWGPGGVPLEPYHLGACDDTPLLVRAYDAARNARFERRASS